MERQLHGNRRVLFTMVGHDAWLSAFLLAFRDRGDLDLTLPLRTMEVAQKLDPMQKTQAFAELLAEVNVPAEKAFWQFFDRTYPRYEPEKTYRQGPVQQPQRMPIDFHSPRTEMTSTQAKVFETLLQHPSYLNAFVLNHADVFTSVLFAQTVTDKMTHLWNGLRGSDDAAAQRYLAWVQKTVKKH